MTHTIQVECLNDKYRRYEPDIQNAILAVLGSEGIEAGELTILLTDRETIKELNQRYMDQDQATDVLAFTSGELNPESGQIYLGDVAISIPVAEEQASQRGHPLLAELVLLVVHGMLHLLGYDHTEQEDRERMFKLQAELLQELGYAGVEPTS
jgi:probable rRNA maturation factor